ncbi:CDP-alcohol phosphatidyltransferase family protein [Thermodesulfobacteriota bacterium]
MLAGLIAAVGQVLDGVDGQFARLTDRESSAGAFLDSVLDRYFDGVLVIGLIIYLIRSGIGLPEWQLTSIGALALIGSGLISYSTARAGGLGIDLGPPTLASKGTRTTVIVICAVLSPISAWIPFAGLCYVALHTNLVVICRLVRAYRHSL